MSQKTDETYETICGAYNTRPSDGGRRAFAMRLEGYDGRDIGVALLSLRPAQKAPNAFEFEALVRDARSERLALDEPAPPPLDDEDHLRGALPADHPWERWARFLEAHRMSQKHRWSDEAKAEHTRLCAACRAHNQPMARRVLGE